MSVVSTAHPTSLPGAAVPGGALRFNCYLGRLAARWSQMRRTVDPDPDGLRRRVHFHLLFPKRSFKSNWILK